MWVDVDGCKCAAACRILEPHLCTMGGPGARHRDVTICMEGSTQYSLCSIIQVWRVRIKILPKIQPVLDRYIAALSDRYVADGFVASLSEWGDPRCWINLFV